MRDFFGALPGNIFPDMELVKQLPPLVLAYVGDAVFEVYVRTVLVGRENLSVHKLHRMSIEYVKARAQSDIVHRLIDSLSPEEQDVVRRGRNAKAATAPKNASIIDYRYATGFESLIGYLFLKRDFQRLMDVLEMAVFDDGGQWRRDK